MSNVPEPQPAGSPAASASLDQRLASRLASLRAAAAWSLDDLAERTGVSRATLSRLERGETSATTHLLSRLCHAYGLTMSRLLAEVESQPVRHLPASRHPVWRDPENGFTRTMRSPPLEGFASELLEVQLPAGTEIRYESPLVMGLEHHLHLLQGRLSLTLEMGLEAAEYHLTAGDTLSFKLLGRSAFQSHGPGDAHYFLVLTQPR